MRVASDLERLTDQFSSEPDGLRPVVTSVVRLFIVNYCDRTRIRTAPADAVDVARLRGVRPLAQYRVADRAGFAGVARRAGRPGHCSLTDRGILAARCRGVLARTLWRANSRATYPQRRMVDGRHRDQRARRAGRGRRASLNKRPSGFPCWRAAQPYSLATGAASLADGTGRAGARRVRRGCGLFMVRRFPCIGVCRARGIAARRGTDPAHNPGRGASSRPAQRFARSRSGSGPTAASSFRDCRWH